MGPPLFLLIGIVLAWLFFQKRKEVSTDSEPPLSKEELERLRALMSRESAHTQDEQNERKTKS
jgi:cytochrome c-type biogenesis protein CcmH/NrfF